MTNNIDKVLWKDRKRAIFGLPWTFTKYTLTEKKLIIESGLFNQKEEEIRLYRIMDVTLSRSLGERIFNLGTIHICSSDKSTPEFNIKRVKNASKVKNLLSDVVEEERLKRNIGMRENIIDGDEHYH